MVIAQFEGPPFSVLIHPAGARKLVVRSWERMERGKERGTKSSCLDRVRTNTGRYMHVHSVLSRETYADCGMVDAELPGRKQTGRFPDL